MSTAIDDQHRPSVGTIWTSRVSTKNTVVFYTSDQGWYLGEHGWYDKRWMYEESLLMPLVVRWPGVTKPGQVCRKMVSNVDFAETFLDICGLGEKIPSNMQGRSFAPILRGETPKTGARVSTTTTTSSQARTASPSTTACAPSATN